ncbi:hypothetical protein [Pseudomonas proteolytica]|uniref:hypothetical protein n=1 Tax=Pseudomonas proteolytica TaxID=219574 RepID=UPI001473FDF0|nr:hypothetical protein [Pseudomonas proteolytica]NMZ38333.1 hypothetical protein [Pseudomonas proteolytica]
MRNVVPRTIVLAPLPEHLRVKTNVHVDGFVSPWFSCEHEGVLYFKFGKKTFDIDLNIPVGNGTLLTEKSNHELLELVKQWIHEQHFPRSIRIRKMKLTNAKKRLWSVLRLIDKLFLNAKTLRLYEYGFGLVTPGTINSYMNEFLKSNSSHESIYSWSQTLSVFMLDKIKEEQLYDFENFVQKNPIFLEPIPGAQMRYFPLDDQEIFRARVWLYHNNFYQIKEGESWPGHIKTAALVKELYPHCIMAGHMRPLPYELEIQSVYGHRRELPYIPVRQDNSSATALRYNEVRRGFMSQRFLSESKLKIPNLSLDTLANNDHTTLLAQVGSYVTLPHTMTIDLLRKSILFYETHSDSILNYFSMLISGAATEGLTPNAYFLKETAANINAPISFTAWDLCASAKKTFTPGAAAQSLERMRNLEGALQTYYLLLGCIQYAVGFFTARRQSELLNIKFKHLNGQDNCITTLVMKTGIGEARLTHDIPVIPLVTHMLSRLERFHQECGLSPEQIKNSNCFGRFSLKRKPGINKPDPKKYNCHLDILCDYFQTDTYNERRYYVRQHQLRRAFAVSFFYLNTRGNLSVLSYYFGHMDFKQIYRYLTTVVGNKEMIDIKSAYLAEETITQGAAVQDLLNKLGVFPPTTVLKVIERQRLESYYKSLIRNEKIKIDTTFLSIEDRDEMLISITVSESQHGK